MKKLSMALTLVFGTALPIGAALLMPSPANAIPVFDVANYTQNLLAASRALDEINNQVKSLQNEAAMLDNMGRNLKTIDFPQLARIKSDLSEINGLMGEAKAIGFKVDALNSKFDAMFPGGLPGSSAQGVVDAKARLDVAKDGFRHSMEIQSQIVSSVENDSKLLAELASASEGAEGALQAQQATNQLLALGAKEQLQLEELLSAEFRSNSIERARQIEAEDQAREATRKFLGTGKAYSSTHE